MKLSQKIILSYVVILALIIVLEVINKVFSGYIREDSEKLSRSEEVLRQSGSMQKIVETMESEVRGYFLLGDSATVTAFYVASSRFDDIYKTGNSKPMSDSGQAKLYHEIGFMVKSWQDTMITPVILAKKDYMRLGTKATSEAYAALFDKVIAAQTGHKIMLGIMQKFSVFDENELTILAANKRDLRLSLFRNDRTSMIMALFILMVGIAVTIAATRNITWRMNTMIDMAEKISLGQFNKKIDDEGTDEMSRLAEALNRMNTSLRDNFVKLQRSNLNLVSTNRDLEQFMYSASHDLKEPVRMVSIYTQLLASRHADQLSESAKEYIDIAVEGSQRIIKLLDSLLGYLNISQFETNFEKVDIKELIDAVTLSLSGKIAENKVVVKVGLMPIVDANREQMKLLFYHLIDNAIHFKSQKKPVIEINVKWEKNSWVFSVSDNGIGIDKQYYEKIFVIFQRLAERTESSGSGVGLTICKKIVELHHGTIWVEANEGKGSVFSFSIPGRQQA
jgi:signal transduction histidine kinase